MAAKNLLNLESVSKAFDIRPLLKEVSLGISEGERIGVVGRNGGGKSTLLKVMADLEPVDSGRIAKAGDVTIGILSQVDHAAPGALVREVVLGDKEVHEWARNSLIREVLTGLFGGFSDALLDRKFADLSGGERRRVNLAKLLVGNFDLLLLDEPTNHLDVEGVAWLASHIKNRTKLAVVVITHDRYFLERVCDRFVGLLDDLAIRDLPGGVDEYLELRSNSISQNKESGEKSKVSTVAQVQLLKKEIAKLEKQLMKIDAENLRLQKEQVELAFDHEKLSAVMKELADVEDRKSEIEEQWLSATSNLEGLTN